MPDQVALVIILAVSIALPYGLLALQEITHLRERKQLYDRLMAKDLIEYKTMDALGPPQAVENHIKRTSSARPSARRVSREGE